jgi:hypothetical protein
VDRRFWVSLFVFPHVRGAIAALGPTLTYGLWVSQAERASPGERAFTLRSISWIDRRLPTPAYMAQAVTVLTVVVVLRMVWKPNLW